MTCLESKELSEKKQKQFKETNFEIFSYAVALHVCCKPVFCLSDLKLVINCLALFLNSVFEFLCFLNEN